MSKKKISKNSAMPPKLGDEARDKVSGFKGIVTCAAQYITGCDCYMLTSKKCGDDGKWFDVGRLEVTKRNACHIPKITSSSIRIGGKFSGLEAIHHLMNQRVNRNTTPE